MSPQAHARFDDKWLAHFFQIPLENSGICLHLLKIAFIFRKLVEFFIYKCSSVIITTEAVCVIFLKAFAKAEKQKSLNGLYAN